MEGIRNSRRRSRMPNNPPQFTTSSLKHTGRREWEHELEASASAGCMAEVRHSARISWPKRVAQVNNNIYAFSVGYTAAAAENDDGGNERLCVWIRTNMSIRWEEIQAGKARRMVFALVFQPPQPLDLMKFGPSSRPCLFNFKPDVAFGTGCCKS